METSQAWVRGIALLIAVLALILTVKEADSQMPHDHMSRLDRLDMAGRLIFGSGLVLACILLPPPTA